MKPLNEKSDFLTQPSPKGWRVWTKLSVALVKLPNPF